MDLGNLETLMEKRVLDHGFVDLRNVAGPTRRPEAMFDADDRDPANAARMSFASIDQFTREQDLKLADYLMRNWHTTPFEMIVTWVEMKMPIFIARQLVRHRTVSINEVSARYVQLQPEWYIPDPELIGGRSKSNKQGRTIVPWSEVGDDRKRIVYEFLRNLSDDCQTAYGHYEWAIHNDIPNELARLHLHVNHYTHWLWKQDLHNLMHMLSLRVDGHAQYEVQQYAQAIYELLKVVLPHSMDLFDKYRRQK